jgi:hypothetical protein
MHTEDASERCAARHNYEDERDSFCSEKMLFDKDAVSANLWGWSTCGGR